MKKALFIVVVGIAVLAVMGIAGFNYAKAQTLPSASLANGIGVGVGNNEQVNAANLAILFCPWGEIPYGVLREYMIDALAEAFEMTAGELEDLLDDDVKPWEIAEGLGLNWKQFREIMRVVYAEAIQEAIADKEISAQEAQWMELHAQSMWAAGGYMPCSMGRFGGRGRSPSWRFQGRPFEADIP